jgi:hypothetical protein
MKIFYAARVVLISFEFVIIAIGLALILTLETQASKIASSLDINNELIKYLILFPVGVFAWMLKEGKDLLFGDVDYTKKLVNWPGYWKLKVHIYVALFYGFLFCMVSATPWFFKKNISEGIGLLLFATGILGCLWSAASIYFAQMSMKEIFNREWD